MMNPPMMDAAMVPQGINPMVDLLQQNSMSSLLPVVQSGVLDKPVQPEEVNVPLGNSYKDELINAILQAFMPSNPIMSLLSMFGGGQRGA